jgi:hypothetical protein
VRDKIRIGKTFGGYTDLKWLNKNWSIAGEGQSFLFQLDNDTKHKCIRKELEIKGLSSWSVTFGYGDVFICNFSDQN